MTPDLVIFDCDGVLVDSEPLSVAVMAETLSEAGLTVSHGFIYEECLGRSMADALAAIGRACGRAPPPEWRETLRERLYERFRRDLQAIPGAEAAALACPRRCVASSSAPERIRLSLKATGLLDVFAPWLYSSSMVSQGKPAPDLFLHAAAAMGAAPGRCLVIEDSPAGIEAARRAGMRVAAFVGGSHAAPARLIDKVRPLAPDAIFDDMRDLPALAARLLRGAA